MKKFAKKLKVFLKFSYLLVFFSMVYSCQNEEFTPSDATNNKTATTKLKTTLVAPFSAKISSGNCNTDCIKVDGPYFKTTDQQIVTWGGPNNDKFSKTVDIEYYNTTTAFILKIKSTNGWKDLVIDGVSSWTTGPVAAGAWGTLTIPLGSGWNTCDIKKFALQITGNGPQAVFDVNYSLFGVCNECVASFTGKAISCGQSREALYKFKSVSDLSYFKIQGGLTNFTGTNAVVTVIGGTNTTTTQSTPSGSSNRIIKVEGAIFKCSEITIRVTWNSTNTGSIITGSWSISTNNPSVALAPIAGLTCN
ncbi:hypothetical protein ACM55G_14120 [Flavobacterium sp. LB3P122]|uniref:hypothetical protein n=1 Tax=Flavobacterium algoriphilum TaxID=3398738 RepID=UPI003A8BE421